MSRIKKLLLIPHIKVQNANALSSPYTIGFPAMTAWLGAVHALQRNLQQQGFDQIELKRVAVISHQFDLHTFKGNGDFVSSIVGTGNPLGKDGKRSAFIEEARCNLDISLLIQYQGISKDDEDEFMPKLEQILHSQMKFASGDVLSFRPPELVIYEHGNKKDKAALNRKLMPGYTLIERRELMTEAMQQGQDAIDAMLDYLKISHQSEISSDGKVNWTSHRKTAGWIVPIATGFHGISKLAPAKNQRDPDVPHRFAESIVTLGEFIMPYRLENIDDMLWSYKTDLNNNLYLCTTQTTQN